MQTPRRIDRHAFLKLTASAMSAGIWSAACSSDNTPPDDSGTGATSNVGGAGGAAAGTSGAPHAGAGTGGGAGTVAHGGAGAGGATGTVAGSSGSSNGGAVARGGAGAGGTPGVAGNAGTAASVGGAGGRGGAGAGGRAAGGATGGIGGAGKSAGAAGTGVGGSAVSGPQCGTLSLSQNAGGSPHDHIPNDAAGATDYKAQVAAHINGPDATMPFMVFIEGPAPGHTHVLLFTQAEIDTLRSGGTLTAKSTEPDSIKDTHIYTIGCKA